MVSKDKSSAIFLDADGVLWDDVGSGGILSGKYHAIQNLSILQGFFIKNIIH
jgi:hypothetical protein